MLFCEKLGIPNYFDQFGCILTTILSYFYHFHFQVRFTVTLSAAGPAARIPTQPNPDAIDIDLGDDNGADEVQSSEVTAATQRADHFELHELDYDNDGSRFHG